MTHLAASMQAKYQNFDILIQINDLSSNFKLTHLPANLEDYILGKISGGKKQQKDLLHSILT